MSNTPLVKNPPNLGPRPGLELIGVSSLVRALGLSRQTIHNRVAAGTFDPMPVGEMSEPHRFLWRRCDLNAAIARKNSNGN